MNTLFPIYLKLHQLNTLLVGGSTVALEKLQALVTNSPEAKIKIVANFFSEETLAFIKANKHIKYTEKPFENSDLEKIDLVIVASNNATLNQEIRLLCQQKNILLNIADTPDLCDFYLGSVVQKGNLKIGISTNGKSPTMAKRLKEFLNDILPEELDETLELMQEYRNSLKGDFKEKVKILNAHTQDLLHSRK